MKTGDKGSSFIPVTGSPGTAKLRAWFLRNLLEAAERELGAAEVSALPERVPSRVRPHLSLDRLRATAALDSIPLDEGEEALVAFDQALGDGSGKVLERVACEMLARQLVQAAAVVRVGDLYGTVARLRGPLEHPFVDVEITFELARTPSGLTLTVGVPGRPRATRLLGLFAAAAIHAAERFARESHAEPLRVENQTFADRARIDAHFRRASSVPPAPDPPPVSRRSSGARVTATLSDEVARILAPGRLAQQPRAPSDAAGRRTSTPVSTRVPDARLEAESSPPPRSDTPPPSRSPSPATPPVRRPRVPR